MIKKADIILAVILIAAGLISSALLSFGRDPGSVLSVETDGLVYGTYPLDEDREIEVVQNGHINKITIDKGYVSMSFSDCPNRDCVHHAPISMSGETIICLPNKVVLEIDGTDTRYDSVAR